MHKLKGNARVGVPFFCGGALGSGRTEASAPTDDKELCASPGAGRCGHRPLRNPIGKHSVGADAHIGPVVPVSLLCVGQGRARPYGELQGAWKNGRGRTPPLRRVTRGAAKRAVEDAGPYGCVARGAGNEKRPAWAGRRIPYAFQLSVRWRHSSS